MKSKVKPMAKIPLHPQHPERICWGCDRYCPADHLVCGNGTVRTQHPAELFGEDWLEWSSEQHEPASPRQTKEPLLGTPVPPDGTPAQH